MSRVMGWACAGLMVLLFVFLAPVFLALAGICYLMAAVCMRGSVRMRRWGAALRALSKEME